ncbi:MAG: fluoride efflux transporter CrcB [Paracoccaceae bacterium]
MIYTILQVAAGGAFGSVLRYLTNVGAMRVFGPGFPMGTLTVNVVGSFVMGALVVLLGKNNANHLAPLLMTGVLGGFTTFSAFSLDTITLWTRGQTGAALLYVGLSLIVSLAAIALGMALFRGIAA